MAEYKLCPMSFSSDAGVRNCIEGKCAWWYVSDGRCSRLRDVEVLREIADHLKQIGMKFTER